MVSVSYSSNVERSDRLNQSVDIAIQEVLVEGEDPLALSSYLWTLKKNRHSLINLANLTNWGMAQVRRVFVDLQIGRRRDEDLSSAALAAIALADTPGFEVIRKAVRAGIELLLNEESERNPIPLKRPAYGALLISAAHLLGVDASTWRPAGERVASALIDAVPGGRLFGLVFAAHLCKAMGDQGCTEKLKNVVTESLDNDAIDFEDQAYLLQALWQLSGEETQPTAVLMSLSAQLLKRVPVWQYLMNGDEHIAPAGDGRAVVYMSHLYRAALLDVLLQYQARSLLTEKSNSTDAIGRTPR